MIKNKKLNTKGSKIRNQNVVDRFVKYDQDYKHKMENRKRQEAIAENKQMKKFFKPAINKQSGTTKKNKSLCKSANKVRIHKS